MSEKKKVSQSLKAYRRYSLRYQLLIALSIFFFTAFNGIMALVVGWGQMPYGVVAILVTEVIIAGVLMVFSTVWYFDAIYKLRL